MPRFRRHRFGTNRRRTGSSPVMQSAMMATRKGKCKACGGAFAIGDPVVRLRLKKIHRHGCDTCGHKLLGVKWFHAACVPADINVAMGFDVTKTPLAGGACAPPPKPPTFEEAALQALAALEHALVIKAARAGITPELEAKFKTFQNIKARVLRPGTPAEGEVATHLALRKIIELVF